MACGPCQRTTQTTSRSSSPAVEGLAQRGLANRTLAGGRLDHVAVVGHGRDLDHAAAPGCRSGAQEPPVALKQLSTGRATASVLRRRRPASSSGAARRCRPAARATVGRIRRMPPAHWLSTSACIRPRHRPVRRSRSRAARPPGTAFTSALPLGGTRASAAESCPRASRSRPSRSRCRRRAPRPPSGSGGWSEPPVASSAAMALTMAALVDHFADGRAAEAVSPALPSTVRTASRVSVSRIASPGWMKAVPGTCRPMASSSIWLLLAVP